MTKTPRALRATVPTLGLLLSMGFAAAAAAAGPALPRFASGELAQAVAATPAGGGLFLDSIEVAGTDETAAFVLERFEVFTADATIIVHGDAGETRLPAPRNAYFRGAVDGEPGSRVVLSVFEDGTAQGIVTRSEGFYLIGGDSGEPKAPRGRPLTLREVDPISLKTSGSGFTCGNDALPPVFDPLAALAPSGPASSAAFTGPGTAGLEKAAPFTARVAIETDFEYYQLFNNVADAIDYAGNLIAYASTIYSAEINTDLAVPSVSLWTTSSDPWGQTSSNTLCGLMEFGRYWNKNNTGVSRTISHFLSGRGLGGGIAWLGVLCSGGFDYSTSCPGVPTDAPWGGGYGFTASLGGAFDITNPTVIWDIVAVSHEIGHNFNSPHTHCYNGIGGNSNPVDQCHTGECASGCNCVGPALPGPQGQRSGTIMSYCHLRSGGFSNISLTFGTTHPFGVLPGRVPVRMSSHVVSMSSAFPGCLTTPVLQGIFGDGFENGTAGLWQ
jgi:hypothetical protein